ncbi:LIM domain-containing protein WLIM2b [Ancistrocladus abbreviatus]
MSFTGTLDKCKACDKTVYVMDQLAADGVSYHKSCFKCSHCKSRLQLSNYSSMEGVLYCKPHFEQLFQGDRKLHKNFQSPVKSAEKSSDKPTPELTRSPSKAASMFSGTQEKCATCGKNRLSSREGDSGGSILSKIVFQVLSRWMPDYTIKLRCT